MLEMSHGKIIGYFGYRRNQYCGWFSVISEITALGGEGDLEARAELHILM